MSDEDFELTLFDRVNVIRDTIARNGEENFYLSYSGGKDSTVLSHLIDMAVPGNRIPRVFINTGIEFADLVAFVKEIAEKDDRFAIIAPSRPIGAVLKEFGYPFKSKRHSHALSVYQNSGKGKYVNAYLGGKFCPKCLRYQFEPGFPLKISEKCCLKLKKEPFKKWAKGNRKTITMTGMRKGEGGAREHFSGCTIFKEGKLEKFNPLFPASEEFEEWLIEKERIKLCKLYYPPFDFKRTGCKGCPYALDLEEQLEIMERYLPAERKQCEIIWKPIYDEYRRIGFRLKKDEQLKLF